VRINQSPQLEMHEIILNCHQNRQVHATVRSRSNARTYIIQGAVQKHIPFWFVIMLTCNEKYAPLVAQALDQAKVLLINQPHYPFHV
jgi:CRISPR/Cas system endoribonuclease Cas6 (RAMP superfamily)